MSSSLGDRNGQRPPTMSRAINIDVEAPSASPTLPLSIPRNGFLPVFLVSSLFAVALSLFCFYGITDADYSAANTRGLVIASSVVGTLLVLMAKTPAFLYNIVLFAHLGLEIYVIERAFVYGLADDADTTEMVLSLTGAGVIIAHLLPFFVYDGAFVLVLLAAVGVVVNTLSILMTSAAMGANLLLPVGLTSVTLLATTQHIVGMMECPCSLLTLYRTKGMLA